MKTIIVIYTNNRINSAKEVNSKPKYSFNTEAALKVGDIIKSSQYSSNMQVTAVLDKCYKYVNCKTGDLSMECNSTNCFAIRELIIQDKEENKIYGTLVNGI